MWKLLSLASVFGFLCFQIFVPFSRIFAAKKYQPFPSLIAIVNSKAERLEASDLVEWVAIVQSD